MKRFFFSFQIFFFILSVNLNAEPMRIIVEGELSLSAGNPAGSSISLAYNGSVSVQLQSDRRFIRGIEFELTAPQRWLAHSGSLAVLMFADFNRQPVTGINEIEGRRIAYFPLSNKVKTIYQVPIRQSHGLRTSPYLTVISDIIPPSSFPILFRLMPIIKGITDELENMQFQLSVKPVLSDEGAVRLNPRYPDQLRGKAFTVLIDDVVISNTSEEILLKEGEHHLAVLSDDYRNESRRFIIEKAKVLELIINLQDPTPLLIFEAPENARIFLNNAPVSRDAGPIPVEAGVHEAKFQVGDYTLIKTITVQRGKTYRIALAVGIEIEESD
ncbi:MAG: hypothetical protein FWH41_09015 [Treponema sp.]|nr:hypothetical protein [Treponema sp.]